MAIRRRRRKLTNLLSTLDRRVKTLEFRPIDLLTSSEQQAAEALADAVDVIVSNAAPNQYLPIEKAYLYGAGVSGSKPRVEVFFGADPGTRKDDRFEVSGLNGSATDDFEVSGSRLTTVSVSREPWDDEERKNFQYTPTDQEPELINSVMYAVDVAAPEGTTEPIELITKAEIASYEGSDSTIRINLTGQHKFKVGDVVYVELGIENPLVFGRDGLFRLTNVDPSFIEYEISSPLAEPINTTPVTTIIRHVYAVGHNFVRDGATWVDNSEATDQVFTWRDIRWVSFNEFVGDDGVAPGPVTNLAGTSESRAVDGITSSVARVTLSWTNPTTNANGNPLDDLLGVQVWHRYNESEPFEKGDVILGDDQTWTKDGFEVKRGGIAVSTVTFRVYAVDSGGLLSEPAEIDVEITPAAKQIKAPTAPQVKQYLGTPTFTWDGLQSDGTLPPTDAYEVEVHISTIDGFSISSGTFQEGTGTFYGSFLAEPGGYLVVNANDLTDGNDYYVRFVLNDIHGNTEVSGQSTFKADVDKPVKFDVIDVGTLDGQLITGLQIQTGPNVNDGFGNDQNGVILTKQGIRAYDQSGSLTFAVDANNGSVRLLNNLTISGYLTETQIDQKLGQIDTSLDGNDLIQAINQATGGGEIAATRIDEDSIITNIAIANRFVAVGSSADDINNNNTTIDGGKITTNSLNANRISGGTIDASKITVSNLNADNIRSGTLKTSQSGERIEIRTGTERSGLRNKIVFYDSGGRFVGELRTFFRMFYIGNGDASLQFEDNTRVTLNTGGVGGSDAIDLNSFNLDIRKNTKFHRDVQIDDDLTVDGTIQSDTLKHFVGSRYVLTTEGGVLYDSSGTPSDKDLKKDIEDTDLGLSFVNSLNPVKYRLNSQADDAGISYGLLAQDLEQVLQNHGAISTSLVGEEKASYFKGLSVDKDTVKSIDYIQLIPSLIKSVQELSARLEELEGGS